MGNFFINLGDFLSEYYSVVIIAVICFVIYLLYVFIPKFFDYSSNKKINRYKHINAKDLQRDNFYRELSGKDLHELLSKWMNLYQSIGDGSFKANDETIADINKMLNDLIKSNSRNTVAICAVFYIVIRDPNLSKQTGVSKYTFEILFILGALVSSLKYDFSGEYVNPKDIIDIKMNDLNSHIQFYKEGIKSAKVKLKGYKY